MIDSFIRGGISVIIGAKCVVSEGEEKITHMYAKSLYCFGMTQLLPYAEIKCDCKIGLDEKFIAKDNSDFSYVFEFDLRYTKVANNNSIKLPFSSENTETSVSEYRE